MARCVFGGGGVRVSARRVKRGGGAAVNRSHRPGQEKSTFCVLKATLFVFAGISPRLPGDSQVARRSLSTLTVPHYAAVPQLANFWPSSPARAPQSFLSRSPVYTSSARLFWKGAAWIISLESIICLLRRIRGCVRAARWEASGGPPTSRPFGRGADRMCVYGAVIRNTWRPELGSLAW